MTVHVVGMLYELGVRRSERPDGGRQHGRRVDPADVNTMWSCPRHPTRQRREAAVGLAATDPFAKGHTSPRFGHERQRHGDSNCRDGTIKTYTVNLTRGAAPGTARHPSQPPCGWGSVGYAYSQTLARQEIASHGALSEANLPEGLSL
jgi:hypothetical protein